MEGRQERDMPLDEIQIDEEFWGPGSSPIVLEWLAENYDPATMPRLQVAEIRGRTGVWLLGWQYEGTEHKALLQTIFDDEYANERLRRMEALREHITRRGVQCPRCGIQRYMPYVPGQARQPDDPAPPALSRTDNRTQICSSCGTDEAMREFAGEPLPGQEKWPLIGEGAFGQGRL